MRRKPVTIPDDAVTAIISEGGKQTSWVLLQRRAAFNTLKDQFHWVLQREADGILSDPSTVWSFATYQQVEYFRSGPWLIQRTQREMG